MDITFIGQMLHIDLIVPCLCFNFQTRFLNPGDILVSFHCFLVLIIVGFILAVVQD